MNVFPFFSVASKNQRRKKIIIKISWQTRKMRDLIHNQTEKKTHKTKQKINKFKIPTKIPKTRKLKIKLTDPNRLVFHYTY